MMSESRRHMLETLAEVWDLAPDVRLGQLMAHLGFLGEDQVDRGLGDIEDDELLAILYRHRKELQARLEGSAPPPPVMPGVISVSGVPIPPTSTPAS